MSFVWLPALDENRGRLYGERMSMDMVRWRAGRRRLEQAGRWLRARPLAGDSLFAGAVAVLFAPWSLFAIVGATRTPRPLASGLAVVVGLSVLVAHGALAYRRVAPWTSFATVSLACLVMAVITDIANLPSVVVFPLALYAYCAYGRTSAPAIGLAVGAVGAVVITAHMALDGQAGKVSLISLYGSLLAVVLAGWSLGLFRRVQLAYIAALEERALRAEAEREERARRAVRDERARIAREMHDVVAHSLAVIVSQAQGGQYAARTDPERAAAVLATIAQAGRQALTDMRGLLGVLRPDAPLSTEDGNSWGPQPTLAELPELLDRVRGAGLPVQYTEAGAARPLGPAAELAAYRVVQEALTNTLKHAGPAAAATVRFTWTDDELAVTVCDSGHGPTPSDGGGHGLIGMRERLAVVGGSVAAGPGPEGGFVVRARQPRRAEAGTGARV